MTSSDEIVETEITLQTKRLTINIDEVTDKIIENLIGIKGRSKSSVVYQLVKDWIDDNGKLILENWDIDFSIIRRQVLTKYEAPIKEKIVSEEDLEIIRELAELFKTIESIDAEELAQLLKIEENRLKNLILKNRLELQKAGLKLTYKDGKFFPS